MKTKLKKVRKGTGLTQMEVAKKANVSIRGYQNYEAGIRVPNVRTAILIAQALNSSVEECFGNLNDIKK